VMDDPSEPARTDDRDYGAAVTVGQLLDLLATVPPETRLLVAVRSAQHFNQVLADIPVTRASIDHGPNGSVLLPDVPGLG